MDWATGIVVQDGQFVAEVINQQGTRSWVELEELATAGLPSSGLQQRKDSLESSFENWTICDSAEYLLTYDIDLQAAGSAHAMYEFQIRDTRFLVPALVLLRALFIPAKHLMPSAFRPQCLEHTGHLSESGFVVEAAWGKPGFRCLTEGVANALRWMYSFPSAYKLAHSVHEFALQGEVRLVLPRADLKFSVVGKKVDRTYYVTQLNISSIHANELPLDFSAEAPRLILYTDFSLKLTSDTNIPARPDGRVELTDFEWESVAPVLLAASKTTRLLLSQRDIFDSILNKLYFGIPWRKVEYKTGGVEHASRAYQCWLKRGTFANAIILLSELRK
jgi:hypothetical protein